MSRHYFRVDGADPETGEESYLVLQADTKPQAERLARQQGLLISSVRVARPEDWENEGPPEAAVETLEARSPEPEPASEPEQFVEGETVDPAPMEVAPAFQQVVARAEPVPATAAVVLACAAVALVVGGVLALTLALWPDHTVRNELQQIGARLHELSQTFFGCMLVVCGMIMFVIAGMFYLNARGRRG